MPDIYISPEKKAVEEAKKIIKNVGEKVSYNPLASFIALPQKFSFETQEADEQIIVLLRQHWIMNVYWIITALIMIMAPLILRYFPLFSFLPANFQLVAIILWYLVTLGFILEKFLSWYFNVFIITDERIIDIDFISLTYRRITEAQIEKIQDVTYKVGGLLHNLFDYGSVYIQTAGPSPEIEFQQIPKPHIVAKVLNLLMIQEQQEKIEGRVR